MLKKISLVLIVISSMTIVISQILLLVGNSVIGQRIFGVALIFFGIGNIMLGLYALKLENKKSK